MFSELNSPEGSHQELIAASSSKCCHVKLLCFTQIVYNQSLIWRADFLRAILPLLIARCRVLQYKINLCTSVSFGPTFIKRAIVAALLLRVASAAGGAPIELTEWVFAATVEVVESTILEFVFDASSFDGG